MAWSKNITIAEIAKQAGVSIATVSRVINQTANVRPDTRSHVEQVMKSLDFVVKPPQPEPADHKQIILVSFPDFKNPFNTEIIRGVHDVAIQNGMDTFFYQPFGAHDAAHTYDVLMAEQRFAGMILAHTIRDQNTLEAMCAKYPIVMCSEHYKSDAISFVAIDDYAAAQTAVNYLLSIGRKKIALINSTLQRNYARHREQGYLDALQDAGLEAIRNRIIHLSDINFGLAVSAATVMLQASPRPDAFFCVSDTFAAAVIKAATNLGLSVPEDVAVVGFDNVELSNMLVPALTTISQPAYQLGAQACRLLLDQIQNHQNLSQHIILNTELIVRAST